MLILPSLSKTLGDLIDQFFFSCPFPGHHRFIMGIIVSHQIYGMLHGDPMLFHEFVDPRVCPSNFSDFGSLPPGGASLMLWSSPFLSRVSFVFGRVASLLMADEALAVLHMLRSFTGREIDLVDVHGIRVSGCSGSFRGLSQQDIAVSSTSELLELYHVLIELSCLVEPLFPFPAGFFLSFG